MKEQNETDLIHSDLDIQLTQEEIDDYQSSPADYNISTYPADYTLEVLYQKWIKGEIKIPPFQRKFVWSQNQASKLIESFMAGLPVPAVYLYIERTSQHHLVIDGQQRLKSIFYFLEGYFGEVINGKRTIFKLNGLSNKSHLYNKRFDEFEESDQLKLKNAVLRSFIINQIDPSDNTSIYHIFERLNRGGTLLSNQEIRNCLYESNFNELLKSLNLIDSWRKILGKALPDKRLRDIELIIRILSLRDITKYNPPLKDHYSKYMYLMKKASDQELNRIKEMFTHTCDSIIESLGEKPFHIRGGINTAVLDSVMISFLNNSSGIPEDIKQRFIRLIDNKDFEKVITGPVPNKSVVEKRFNLSSEILFH